MKEIKSTIFCTAISPSIALYDKGVITKEEFMLMILSQATMMAATITNLEVIELTKGCEKMVDKEKEWKIMEENIQVCSALCYSVIEKVTKKLGKEVTAREIVKHSAKTMDIDLSKEKRNELSKALIESIEEILSKTYKKN